MRQGWAYDSSQLVRNVFSALKTWGKFWIKVVRNSDATSNHQKPLCFWWDDVVSEFRQVEFYTDFFKIDPWALFKLSFIYRSVAKIHLGQMEYFELGNLDSRRDWGHAKDYVVAMWHMLQLEKVFCPFSTLVSDFDRLGSLRLTLAKGYLARWIEPS